jgi:alpha-galactosidase
MEDGSHVVGLFYTDDFSKTPESYFKRGNETSKQYSFDFEKVGLKGKWLLRDVWRQKDLGEFAESFKTEISYHGVVMLRLTPKN